MNEKWLKYIVVLLSSGVLILGTLALTMDRANPASTDMQETGTSRTEEPAPSTDATDPVEQDY